MTKRFITFFILSAIVVGTTYAQELKYVHPTPIADEFSCVSIIPNSTHIVALGEESHTVLTSSDFGRTMEFNFPLDDGEASAFQDIVFLDDQMGLLCKQRKIYRTTDGGNTWNFVYESRFFVQKMRANFNGFVVGINAFDIVYSSDFGQTWTQTEFPIDEHINDVSLLDNGVVFVGADMGVFMRSEDGGLSWNARRFTSQENVEQIYFMSENTGFVQGFSSSFTLFTEDGGENWEVADYPGFFALRNLEADNGVLWGINDHDLFSSLDSGATWQEISEIVDAFRDPQGDQYSISIADFDIDGNRIVAVGNNGVLITSEDQGQSWTLLSNIISDDLIWDIRQYGDEVMTVGQDGTVMFSSDAGVTWSSAKLDVFELQFVERFDNGDWIVGGSRGAIFITEDFGQTWTDNIGPEEADDLTGGAVLPDQSVIIIGEDGTLFKTVDRGNSWINLETPFTNTNVDFISSIDFLTSDYGIIGGAALQVYVTNDGGLTWEDISIDGGGFLRHAQMIDSNYFILASDIEIYKTQDAGMTYERISNEDFRAVYINESGQGVAHNSSFRQTYTTTDFGESWTLISNKGDRLLNTGFVSAEGDMWIVGFNGIIWNDKDAFMVTDVFDAAEPKIDFLLYPNPSAGEINIALQDDFIQMVSIEISDLLGKKVYSNLQWLHNNHLNINLPLENGNYLLTLLDNKGDIINVKRFTMMR